MVSSRTVYGRTVELIRFVINFWYVLNNNNISTRENFRLIFTTFHFIYYIQQPRNKTTNEIEMVKIHHSPVTNINYGNDEVTVTTLDGTSHVGDLVISTIPLGVLKSKSVYFRVCICAWSVC